MRGQARRGLPISVSMSPSRGLIAILALQILNCLERVGGDLNAFTNKEDTVFYAAILKEHLPRAVDLLTDIVFNSTYPEQEIEHEKDVICDEIESYNDSPCRTDL